MNSKLNKAEREHLSLIKQMSCGVCAAPAPSSAHHIKQGLHYLCIPLCWSCHQSPFNGIHGQARIWSAYKKDEMAVLNETIKQLKELS